MEELKFYVSAIDGNLLKTIGGKTGELINLLKTEDFANEEALAARLYKGERAWQNYLNLKQRARRILEALYLVNSPKKGSETFRKMQQCRKLYHLAMHRIEEANRAEAKKMLGKAYRIATEYGFTLLACNCAVELMIDASLNGKASKFAQYSEYWENLLSDLKAEYLAQKYYFQIIMHTNKKRGVTKDLFTELISKLEDISCTSTKFLEYYYSIRVLRNLNALNYSAIKQNTEKALSVLEKRKGVPDSVLQLFHKDKAIAHIALKEYPEARELLSAAKQYAPPYSLNMGILHYYEAVNELHSGHYEKAYELYRRHRKSKYDTLSNQWAVMGPYLYFFRYSGELAVGKDRFPVGKYLNENAGNIHDKKGNKINVMIGELLILVINDRDKFIDRVAVVEKYKHLKGKEVRRAKYFIRILAALPKANFNPVAVKRNARRQFDNLEKNPIGLACNMSVEIAPFEALIEVLFRILG